MSFSLKEISSGDDKRMSFDLHIRAILKYLSNTWDVKAEPKEYDSFKKNPSDTDTVFEKELNMCFDGHDDGTTLGPCFVEAISSPYVYFNDTEQACRPLETLIGAILTYGALWGKRICELDNNSESNRRIGSISHCINMLKYKGDDPEIDKTYEQELEDLIDIKKSYREAENKWDSKRKEIEKNRFLDKLKKMLSDKEEILLYKSDKKEVKELWGYIFQMDTFASQRWTELLKDFEKLGIEIEKDGELFKVRKKVQG